MLRRWVWDGWGGLGMLAMVDASPLGLGWGGVGMLTFLELGHMVDATPLGFLWGRCGVGM